jgi:hypothetical protein
MIPTPNPADVQLWYHYEEIAMHFNGLIMQFRLQLLGGVGAIGTVAGYLISEKVAEDSLRRQLRTGVSFALLVLVAALASIDVFYYDRLLRGAVDALLAFERQHQGLDLSTRIEVMVGGGKFAIRWVYGAVLIVLLSFAVWSAWDAYQKRGRQDKRPRAAA